MPRQSSVTALVVDDSVTFRQYISTILRVELGFDSIVEASNGDEAVEIIDSNKHQIGWIFSDWEMPGSMSGGDLLAHVRERKDMVNVPFVMLTDRIDMRARAAALHEGATDFLVKPFEPDALVTKVLRLLGLKEMRRSERFRLDAHCIIDIGQDENHQYPADLINLSRHGCLVRTSRFYSDTGHVLDYGVIRIQPAEKNELVINAQIVRIERDNRVEDHILVAFEFQEIDPDTFGQLDMIVSEAEKKSQTTHH